MTGDIESFKLVCSERDILKAAFEFYFSVHGNHIRGFYIDETGYLVFSMSDNDDNAIKTYPFQMTSETLTIQTFQWLHDLTSEELEKMKCTPTGYEENYEIGLELFTPESYSDEYGLYQYSCLSVLAVKPKLIEWGK